MRVTGEDAFPYLQSQFSNDLRRPGDAAPATYGLWLTRKGKVAADSLVARLAENEFLLISFHTPTAALAEKVAENIIADDVETDSPAWPGVTLAGPGAADALASAGLETPVSGSWARTGALLVVASRRGGDSYEIFATDGDAGRLDGIFKPDTSGAGAAKLESLRLESGIPRVPEDCGPSDLPQEAGLDADAVSFTKGCYLGQEVMARLQSQGRANRVLTRVLISKDVLATPGTKLFSQDAEAGEIRSVANTGAGCEAMAMLRLRVAETAATFSVAPGGEPSVTRIPAS